MGKNLFETKHKILFGDSRSIPQIPDQSIDLVVTSPPYPMIQMWDDLFSSLSHDAKVALDRKDGNAAFDAMHLELDKVWREVSRIIKPGAFVCINIGDATRTICGNFQLYPNHARIISSFRTLGFDTLPVILWRKPTNAPNKFMGSGMLPSGAYITLEHEYILIFRKGSKRIFKKEKEKALRMKSAFFWEERNKWFSDIWDFKGASQFLNQGELRTRSAAFPFELARRLVNMYSLYEDTVLDPFMGTGTTALACIASGRNSVGIEIDKAFYPLIAEQERGFGKIANELITGRIGAHLDFIASHQELKGETKYVNHNHGFPVVTRQETGIQIFRVSEVMVNDTFDTMVTYEPVGKVDSPENTSQSRLK